MLTLYTSNATARYVRDALAVLAAPTGFVYRFRYHRKHVAEQVRSLRPGKASGANVMVVYAQRCQPDPKMEFEFFPLRFGTVVALEQSGSIVFIDVRLGGYVSVADGASGSIRDHANAFLKADDVLYPLPQPVNGQGLGWDPANQKLRHYQEGDWAGDYLACRDSSPEGLVGSWERNAWEAVIDMLADSDLARLPFYRIEGVYYRARALWTWPPMRVVDKAVVPRPRWPEVDFRLPMGQHVVLRIETYRKTGPIAFRINVHAAGDGIAGWAPKSFRVDSRYDQQRVLVAVRRMLGDVLSTIVVSASVGEDVVATSAAGDDKMPPYSFESLIPEIVLPARAAVVWWTLVTSYVAIAASVLLLAASSGFWESVGTILTDGRTDAIGRSVIEWKDHLTVASKAVGALVSVGVSLLLLRKTRVG